MTATFQRKLTVTADTSGLAKGAKDVQAFGRTTGQLSAEAQKMAAAFAKQSQAAAREMASMSKAIEAELKPLAAEMRKMQTEALKTSEALQKRTLSDARAAEALRKTYDTGYANASKYLQVEAQVQTQIAKRNLTVEQGNAIMAGATARFKQFGDDAKTANDNVKLTTNQVQGLGYQLNDVGTMLAMGASPFQVMASQAGQVVQVLGDGPGGMRGSLAAIGTAIAGAARAVGPWGLALGAATAAAGVFWATSSDEKVSKASESADRYKKVIDGLRNSFGAAADAADSVFSRAAIPTQNTSTAEIATGLREAKKEAKAAIEALSGGSAVSLKTGIIGGMGALLDMMNSEMRDAQSEIRGLYAQFSRGEITAKTFADQMARIEIKPGASEGVRTLAGEMRLLGKDVADAATNTEALQSAMDAIVSSRSRLPVPSEQDRPLRAVNERRFGDRLDPDGMGDIRNQLLKQQKELQGATKEADTYGEALKALRGSLSGSVEDLQLQIVTLGQSEGAIAAARMKTDGLREAQEAATEAGRSSIDPDVLTFIEKQAVEYGRLTDQLNTATEAQRAQAKAAEDVKRQQERVREFAADLEFERSIATLPDVEQSIRETLRGLGVEYDSFEGGRLAAGMRYNDALRETRDEMENTRDAAADFVSTLVDGLTSGKGALDTLISAFAGLGKQMASAGLDKLMDGLFGNGGGSSGQSSGIGGLANAFSGLTQAITKPPTASEVFGGGSSFSAPTTPVQRGGALQALTEAAPAAAAAASGEMLKYAGRFNSGVDGRLMTILKEASTRFDMPVTAVSGLRPSDKRFHGQGIAADVSIAGLGNYQDAGTFRTYEKFAQLSKQVQSELFPELEGMLRWGGYFSGGKGKYGAVDNMHFDLAGKKVGMGGGTWEGGLTLAQRKMWPGAQSVGMGANDNALRQAVKLGTTDYARSVSSGGAPSLLGGFSPAVQKAFAGGFDGFSTNTASWHPGAPAIPGMGGAAGGGGLGGFMNSPLAQGGLTALSAGAAGYQSGSPLGGAFSGLMGGLATGNPIMAGIGAIAGLAGGLKSKSKHTREKQAELDASTSDAWESTEIAA
ncbi:hypothetical protein ASG43_17655 [Aureimonas sp. Leaf454]|uniref:phage tail length tape measure family protein n=1 Tax=Aureimonas sp. Leaf454 TaxID=1736381 RepID=UPI0006F3D444|nr:phage tail length tape measure family protein [Aureimonas sp. Leaf454]KQT53664.1 hypothetical protein ASG43_17655 [Aureimonas sp. Leaf454]